MYAPLESAADLEERLAYARTHAAKVGRTRPLDICAAPFTLRSWIRDRTLALCDEIAALEAIGVNWLTISLPARSREAFCQEVLRFGSEIIAR